jgi:hypothetical protein
MSRHVLAGLQRAARITCDTAAVRDELIGEELVPADRLVVAPVGVGTEYSPRPDPDADREAARVIASRPGAVELLHVGSTIPEKRVDLLRSAASCGTTPNPPGQGRRVYARSGAPGAEGRHRRPDFRPGFSSERRGGDAAPRLLQPSDREGIGLPLIEAMAWHACRGSDLAVLREVGGSAVEYHPVVQVVPPHRV